LPPFPHRIGVVTSSAGAVFHDICNVLERRWPLVEVVLSPTPVQGAEAPAGVVAAIETLNQRSDIDVIIVARGGGSLEELWTFNEERVARAVFGSLVPVVSAVGHETDVTLCDYVADLRAPTPSAAAELVAPDRLHLSRHIGRLLAAGLGSVQRSLTRERLGVGSLLLRAEAGPASLNRQRLRLDELEARAYSGLRQALRDQGEAVERCRVQLAALDPQATLNRGYAVVHKGGSVVASVSEVASGDALVVKVRDGGFPARVAGTGQRRVRSGKRNGERPQEPSVQPLLII
jgi:exodeoxyribonuclease VII large subunit